MKSHKLLMLSGAVLIMASVALAGPTPGGRSQERQNSIHGNQSMATHHEAGGVGHMHTNSHKGTMHTDKEYHHVVASQAHRTRAGKSHHAKVMHRTMMETQQGSGHHKNMATTHGAEDTDRNMNNEDKE